MAFNFMLPLRIAQFILAILVLGLEAYGMVYFEVICPFQRISSLTTHLSVASWWNKYLGIETSPDRVNFLIFNGIWTALLVIPFLTLAPRYLPRAAHPYAILGVEAVTMIFWFAGFIAHAVFVTPLMRCRGNVCKCAQAATVLAAFEWCVFPHHAPLFSITCC
jgi:Membrane-associating domain